MVKQCNYLKDMYNYVAHLKKRKKKQTYDMLYTIYV